MSHSELDDQVLRVSCKRSWEKLIESLEFDRQDSTEIVEKTLESDNTTACDSVGRRDSEIHRFLDETDKKCCKERECSEKIIKELKTENESLKDKVVILENLLEKETEKSKRYFNAIESLEKDNEKWEEECLELKEKCRVLNEKLSCAEQQIETNRQESIMKMLGKGRKASGNTDHQNFERKLIAKIGIKKMKTRTEFSTERKRAKSQDKENSEDEVVEKTKECEEVQKYFKGKKSQADDLWMKKFKFLKQKLLNEQKKSRDFEFLIRTQNQQLENVEKNLSHLKAEKRFVEHKVEKMKEELNVMNEARLRERSKIDNVVAFCDLFHNCVFPKEELIEKLEKVPSVISSFLKGSIEAMTFENKENTSGQLINSVKKHDILKHFETKSARPADPCVKSTAKELENIRSTLNDIAETLVQVTPSADPTVLKNLNNISHVHLSLEECRKTDSHFILNPHLSYNGKKGKINNIFKMAIRNTHNTWWNVKSGGKTSTEVTEQSSEGDESSILPIVL